MIYRLLLLFYTTLISSCAATYASSANDRFFVGANEPEPPFLERLERKHGISLDGISIYKPISTLAEPSFLQRIERESEKRSYVVVNVLWKDIDDPYRMIEYGKYDASLIAFARFINGRNNIIVTTMHEFNQDYYRWGAYAEGNDIEGFKSAWGKFSSIFRRYSPETKLMLHYNRTSKNFRGSYRHTICDFLPPADQVDLIGVSVFNRAYATQWHQRWDSFDRLFSTFYKELRKCNNLPIILAEIGTTSYSNKELKKDPSKKGRWFIQTLNVIRSKYNDDIYGIILFLQNKTSDDTGSKPLDWGLNHQRESRSLQEALRGAE